MDIVPSICLSSLAGALFFFTGGRLSNRLPRAGDEKALEAERAARTLAEGEAASLRSAREEAARSALEARRALDEERAARAQEAQRAAAEIARREDEGARTRAQEAQRAAAEIARLQGEGARLTAHATALGQQVAELEARLAEGADAAGRAKANSGAVETRALAAEARALAAEKRAAALASELEKARAEIGEAEARGRREAENAAKARETQLRKQLEQTMSERATMAAQLDAARANATAAASRAAEADKLRAENAELVAAKAALERDRAAAPDLAELQRRTVELAMRARVLDQRGEELERTKAENAELHARVEVLDAASREAEQLRRRVAELEAQGFARRLEEPPPPSRPTPQSGRLATVLERELGRLVEREEGCRMAVLADPRGLLIASSAGAEYPHEVAAASSLTTTASDRLRELMPLGAPASLELYDENGLCMRTRWFRFGEECFLVSTVGVVDPNDPEGAHLRARLGELIGGP